MILDKNLQVKVDKIFNNFNQLFLLEKQYQLAFSGGKDSHCLLGLYLYWSESTNQKLDIEVVFSDTLLEEKPIYLIIDKVQDFLRKKQIKFRKTYPKKSYWFYQFALGYPVPNWKNRWCTKFLKTEPMKTTKITLTGRHKGESEARDKRLSGCQSGECGVSQIKDSYDPIINLTNCDVWDLLFYLDVNRYLYKDCFHLLNSTYSGNEDEKGSLRMGCIHCPVISRRTLAKRANDNHMKIRLLLEELRDCRRINSPRTKKKGAIFVEDRAYIWDKIKPILIEEDLISYFEILEIELALINRQYPPTYPLDWILKQEKLLQPLKIQLNLFEM